MRAKIFVGALFVMFGLTHAGFAQEAAGPKKKDKDGEVIVDAKVECARIRVKAEKGGKLSEEERGQLSICASFDEFERGNRRNYRVYIPRDKQGRVDG